GVLGRGRGAQGDGGRFSERQSRTAVAKWRAGAAVGQVFSADLHRGPQFLIPYLDSHGVDSPIAIKSAAKKASTNGCLIEIRAPQSWQRPRSISQPSPGMLWYQRIS